MYSIVSRDNNIARNREDRREWCGSGGCGTQCNLCKVSIVGGEILELLPNFLRQINLAFTSPMVDLGAPKI